MKKILILVGLVLIGSLNVKAGQYDSSLTISKYDGMLIFTYDGKNVDLDTLNIDLVK